MQYTGTSCKYNIIVPGTRAVLYCRYREHASTRVIPTQYRYHAVAGIAIHTVYSVACYAIMNQRREVENWKTPVRIESDFHHIFHERPLKARKVEGAHHTDACDTYCR